MLGINPKMVEGNLPSPEYLSRRLLQLLSQEVYEIAARSRIGRSRKTWGLHDETNIRLLIRRGLSLDEARRTLIHEGLHALYPPDLHPHATEEAVERRTQEIDRHIGPRRRKRLESFLPPD